MEGLHHLSVSEVCLWERAVLNAALETVAVLETERICFQSGAPRLSDQSTVMKITFRVRCLNERA